MVASSARGSRRGWLAPGRVLGFAGVVGLGAANGGWSAVSWGWAALAFCGAAAVVLVFEPRRPVRGGAVLVVGLALLTCWTGLSPIWSASVPASVLEVERDLVYLAAVGLAVLVEGEEVERGVLAACVVLCGWNLLVRLHGYNHSQPGAEAAPIGYANGLGLVAAIGCVLALGRRGRLPALAVVVPALLLAGSDGSYLAAACGVAVAWKRRLAPLVAVAGALVVLAGLHGHERSHYWNVALADARAHPALGSGAGTFAEEWVRRRPVALSAQDAHSLELETLAELGLVGLALLAIPLAAPFVAGRGVALGAYAAWIVQSGIDWEWELPAVTLAGLFCAVAALRPREPSSPAPVGVRGRAVGIVAALGVAAFSLVGLVGNSAIAGAQSALRAGDTAEARSAARRAREWAPWSAEPWRIVSQAHGADVAALRRAIELDPNDWSLWAELAAATRGRESRRAAARAARLNPLAGTGG